MQFLFFGSLINWKDIFFCIQQTTQSFEMCRYNHLIEEKPWKTKKTRGKTRKTLKPLKKLYELNKKQKGKITIKLPTSHVPRYHLPYTTYNFPLTTYHLSYPTSIIIYLLFLHIPIEWIGQDIPQRVQVMAQTDKHTII